MAPPSDELHVFVVQRANESIAIAPPHCPQRRQSFACGGLPKKSHLRMN